MDDPRPLPTKQQLAKARRLLRFAKDELEKAAKSTNPSVAWGFWTAAAKHVEMTWTFLGLTLPDYSPDDLTNPGFRDAPQDFPSDQSSRRTMEAIQRAFAEEFADELQVPNVTLVATMPPDGRIAVASTEPDAEMILMALREGWGAAHRTWRLGRERAARQ